MHAHEYGSKHFKHKTNFKDLVVFSDVQQQKIKETAVPSPNIYVEIEKGVKTANKWLLHFNSRLSGEYGDFFLENNSPYGQINKLQYEENDENFAFIQNTIVDFQNGTLPYYKINEKFYIQLDNSIDLEEVIVNATPSPTTRDVKSIQYEAFTTVFISEDGAQLLQAYEAIQNVSAHEVVIFIERSSGSNLFGTVFRIKKGKNVNSLIETNRIRIAKIVRAYGVDVFTNELSKMLEQELKKSTESDFYLVLKKGGQIVRWGADVTLSNLSKFLKSSGEEIGKLQLSENYWKTTVDGKENSKYNPLLPKLNINESFSSEELANSIYKNYVVPIEAPIVTFAERFNKHWLFKELMPFKSERITKLFKHIPGILKEFLDGVKENAQNTYNFINGLLVGIINSIIDFFKSIFDILAILVDVLNGVIQTGKFFEKPGHYLRLLAEGFENLIDLVLNTFTLTNLKAWMQFLIEMPITTAKLLIGLFAKASNTKITIDPGALGYYIGFLVGFIASEVVQFIATGGTANIAKATKAVLKSYQELANVVAKKVVKTAEITVDVVLAAIRKLKEFAKNFAKHLDNLKKWIGEFIEKLASKVNQLFKGFEAVLELLYDLGVVIFEKLDPNTGKVLVSPDGVIYTVKQGDKTILEGTEDAIRKFAQKIDEIRSSGGNIRKKTQSYLDELADSLNVKHKNFLETNGLRIEKPTRARNNLQLLDKNGDVYFYGKPEEVDEYIRLTTRTNAEKIADYKKVIEYFDSSTAKYRREKIWDNGDALKFSEHNTPPLSVDFKHTPQFLYGKKNGKPGVVKIKLTGNDLIDFKMAFKKAGISDDLAKNLKEDYVWHHLDDFNPVTGECSMQLINRKVHEFSCPHIGGGGLYKAFMGIGYPNRKINFSL
ncbi:HNH endonuclease [Tenacibaculum sp. XPcli2-G]|uniref:HNH endonuclease n=1 Tax=Tenacibaculum sp. XPcli2-G TaxID=2954503 RepID=UPI0020978FEE|nr:HNH endonuclease [Tenacibaculum sp. XPcli2-G]MCO7184131.1 HNH endonuclease [Tenacibaculum sp. XPcli2-G]